MCFRAMRWFGTDTLENFWCGVRNVVFREHCLSPMFILSSSWLIVSAWVVHRDVLMFQVLKLSELCRYQVFIILGVCVRAVSLRAYFVPLLLRSYVEECSRLTTAPWVRAFITDIYDDLEFMLHWLGSRVEVRLEILSDVPAGSLF